MESLDLTTRELWDCLVNSGMFTNEELRLLTNINGYNMDTLNDAIYSRYGFRDYEQMIEYFLND